MILIIVESPAKCKKIEEYLGSSYKCVASYGHFRELNGLKSIDSKFNLSYFVSEYKMKYVDKMKKLIISADDIILATDDDREGEAIAWHICDYFNLSTALTKRIIFNEITEPAIQYAVNHPTTINMNLVYAQQSRQILDILIGYKFSPLLWRYISSGNTTNSLSAGRCQTPALRIIYDNYKELLENKETKELELSGYFTSKNILYSSNYKFEDGDDIRIFLLKNSLVKYTFSKRAIKESLRKPPMPFTTSSLQITASNVLKTSPKQTMSICQKLYEAGLITYMRTDSKKYSNVFIETVKEHVSRNYGDEYLHKNIDHVGENIKKDTKAQEAHEAIRPTNIKLSKLPDKYEGKLRSMYKIIWKNTLQSCMADSKYQLITSTIQAPDYNDKPVIYTNLTDKNIFLGWRIVENINESFVDFEFINKLKNEQNVKSNKIMVQENIKNVKQHISEAKLVNLLEDKNIGRPSTFAQIVDKIQERNYVVKKNIEGKNISCKQYILENKNVLVENIDKKINNEHNKLVIQPTGILVIEFLIEHFNNIFSYNYSENMENELDNISKNIFNYIEFCNKHSINIQDAIKEFNDTSPCKTEITIDEHHVFMIGKYGPVIKRTINNKTDFLKVDKNIELEDIKRNNLKLEDILEKKNVIGEYKNHEITLKDGKFGKYLHWNNNNYKVSKDEIKNINLEISIDIIENDKKTAIVRTINNDVSIRNGKFGDYIFYKTGKMNKPKFISLKTFKHDYKNCKESLIMDYIKQ